MEFRSGLVALIGKPNVGKSTLLNQLVGQKVSIVSDKPQTTRRRVLGIVTTDTFQVAFVDTPGIHEPHTRLGKAMVEAAKSSLVDIDLVVFVADSSHKPDDQDKEIAKMMRSSGDKVPVVLCLNKMDRLRPEHVQDYVEAYTSLTGAEAYMLTTATRGLNVPLLMEKIVERLPKGEPMYDPDDFTDQTARFMVAELVREKILIATRQEVPHATAVQIEEWEEPETENGVVKILATIVVEKDSQKAILIGKQGRFLREVGTRARAEIEELLQRRVYLELFVKVREGWRMNPRMLHEMEYME